MGKLERFVPKERPTSAKMNEMVDEMNTNTEKLKTIEDGAQKNLPNTVTDPNYVHTDNNYSNEEKRKVQQNTEKLSELEGKTGELEKGLGGTNEALSLLETQVKSLDSAVTNIVHPTVDDSALPALCGQPPILFGAGTPQEAIVPDNWKQFDPETGEGYNWNGEPSAAGQQYINTSASTGGRYIAVPSADGGLTWKNF